MRRVYHSRPRSGDVESASSDREQRRDDQDGRDQHQQDADRRTFQPGTEAAQARAQRADAGGEPLRAAPRVVATYAGG